MGMPGCAPAARRSRVLKTPDRRLYRSVHDDGALVGLERLELRFEALERALVDEEASSRGSVAALAPLSRDGFVTDDLVEHYISARSDGESASSIASGAALEAEVEDHIDAPLGDGRP